MLRIDTRPAERFDEFDGLGRRAEIEGVGEGITFLLVLAASWAAAGVAGWVIWRLVTL